MRRRLQENMLRRAQAAGSLRQMFARYDLNCDGQLGQKEFRSMLHDLRVFLDYNESCSLFKEIGGTLASGLSYEQIKRFVEVGAIVQPAGKDQHNLVAPAEKQRIQHMSHEDKARFIYLRSRSRQSAAHPQGARSLINPATNEIMPAPCRLILQQLAAYLKSRHLQLADLFRMNNGLVYQAQNRHQAELATGSWDEAESSSGPQGRDGWVLKHEAKREEDFHAGVRGCREMHPETLKHFLQLAGVICKPSDFAEFINWIDVDKDGMISLKELQCATRKWAREESLHRRREGNVHDPILMRFHQAMKSDAPHVYDIDGTSDVKISLRNRQELAKSIHPRPPTAPNNSGIRRAKYMPRVVSPMLTLTKIW